MSSFTFCPRTGSAVCPVNIRETPLPHQHLEAKPHCWGRGAGGPDTTSKATLWMKAPQKGY